VSARGHVRVFGAGLQDWRVRVVGALSPQGGVSVSEGAACLQGGLSVSVGVECLQGGVSVSDVAVSTRGQVCFKGAECPQGACLDPRGCVRKGGVSGSEGAECVQGGMSGSERAECSQGVLSGSERA